jgi:hypothetical protein
MNRVIYFILNILFSGALLYGLFLFTLYAAYSLTPTSFWFHYDSVEPYSVPVDITKDYILMQSNLTVSQTTNLNLNDVLRCFNNGHWSYYSQYDSNAETILIGKDKVSVWKWRGTMPQTPALCRMDSTITTKLPMGIEKTQFIKSQEFMIE